MNIQNCPICGSEVEIETIVMDYYDPLDWGGHRVLGVEYRKPDKKKKIDMSITCEACNIRLDSIVNCIEVKEESIESEIISRKLNLERLWNSFCRKIKDDHPHKGCKYAWSKIKTGKYCEGSLYSDVLYIDNFHFCGLMPLDRSVHKDKRLCSEFHKKELES